MFSDLTFASPWWLWGLFALPALAGLFVWAEAEAGRRLARLIQAPRLRGQLTGAASAGRRRARFALLLAGLAALLFAAAAPRAGYETRDVHRRGLDVIVIADVSKSMLAQDLPPSRLVREKLAVQDLTTQLQGDRLGLVAFAGSAFLQAPLTLDYDAVLNAAAELDTDLIPRGGTNFGDAIDLALEAFGKTEGGNRAIILFTDGEPTDDTEQGKGLAAAARAAEAGVRIYTVGFGTPEGALIPLGGEGNFVRDLDGKIVHTALDEGVLTALAKAANGFYVRFAGEASIKTVAAQGLGRLKTGEIDARQTRRPIERYQWPLGAGILCLSLAALLGERRRTRAAAPAPRKIPAPALAVAVVAWGIGLGVGTPRVASRRHETRRACRQRVGSVPWRPLRRGVPSLRGTGEKEPAAGQSPVQCRDQRLHGQAVRRRARRLQPDPDLQRPQPASQSELQFRQHAFSPGRNPGGSGKENQGLAQRRRALQEHARRFKSARPERRRPQK